MGQYLLIPFLVGWTSIYQLFWCSPGVQGFDTLPYICQYWNDVDTFPFWLIQTSGGTLDPSNLWSPPIPLVWWTSTPATHCLSAMRLSARGNVKFWILRDFVGIWLQNNWDELDISWLVLKFWGVTMEMLDKILQTLWVRSHWMRLEMRISHCLFLPKGCGRQYPPWNMISYWDKLHMKMSNFILQMHW